MKNLLTFFKKKDSYILIAILLLAAFLRLYNIRDYLTFLGDEGRDVLVVYGILHGHFTLLGPTSSVGGFFLGPVYYYMIAPFLWLFQYDPVGPAVMVALFGVATVWLVYKVGTEFFCREVGYIASILFAISPLVIDYSRSSWNPNVMPFFTILTLYLLYKAVRMFSVSASGFHKLPFGLFVLTGVMFGIMMQLHYLALFVGAIIIAYILLAGFGVWITRHKEKKSFHVLSSLAIQYMGVLIGFLGGFSPYIAFEARHGFPNTRNILMFIFHSKDVSGGGGNYFAIIGDVFFRLFGRLVTGFPAPEHLSSYSVSSLSVWFWVTLVLGIFSCGFFLWEFGHVFKRLYCTDGVVFLSKNKSGISYGEKFLSFLLLFLWFVIGVLLFGFYKKNIYDYYFTFLFPVPFLLVGDFLWLLWKQRLYGRIIFIVIFLVLFVINIQQMPFRYPANKQLQQAEDIAGFVLSKTDNKPFNFALITGGNSDHAYRYFFTIWGRPSTIIDNTIHDPMRTSVTDQLFVVCESLPCYPLGNSLFEIAGFGRAEIVGHWSISVVEVYKLQHYAGKP